MKILEVSGLTKTYPAFKLDGVSFALEQGRITGFIGRNGAGKSTTLNSLFNFVHPDCGEARFWGMDIGEHEFEIKQRVGFVGTGVNYYPLKKIKKISAVTASFYDSWDEAAYRRYMTAFELDESKSPSQLSAGMKVKYALALALSHSAELLILDEPTSGLDPVSREELLEVFMGLADEGKTILFSTHITSDLDKCADDIIYIKKGRIAAETALKDFVGAYRVVEYSGEAPAGADVLIGERRSKDGHTALIRTQDAERLGVKSEAADLEAIMIHFEKEGD